MSASPVQDLANHWNGHLARYRTHKNTEHLEALIGEATRFNGFALENDLSRSPYWSRVSLAERTALLLALVDRGVVIRSIEKGQAIYRAREDAVLWATGEPTLAKYLVPTLELIAALQALDCRPATSRYGAD